MKGWLDKYQEGGVAKTDATRTLPALNYRSVEDSARIEREKELARRKTSVGPQSKPSVAMKQAAEERYAQQKRNEKYKKAAEYAQVIGGGLEVAAPFTGPLAPIIGGAGTLASAGSSAYLSGRDVADENYGSALMNAGFGGLGIAGYTPVARATNVRGVNVAKAADAADYVSDVAGTYNAYDEYGRNYASKVQGISKDEIGDVVKSWLGMPKPLSETTNKNSLKVLEDFKQRIQTPEGQRRLKELGIPDDSFLQQIKIVDDPSTLGVYRPYSNTVGVNPDLPNSNFTNSVVRHEIEHGVQDALGIAKMNKYNYDAGNFKYLFRPTAKKKALEEVNKLTTPIDDILSNVELRKTPEKVDWDEIKTNRGKQDPSKLFDYLSHKQNATNYFDSGSGGGEKSAFLGELQQYMLDNKYLNHPYETVTPDKVKDVFANAIFDEENKGKYLRLFNVMKPTDNNFQLLSKGLNKMLSAPTVIGAGAAAATLANQPEQKKNGGWLDKYEDGGEINYNDSNASAGPGFQGDGYSNVGRNYSPAWGGQFKEGGEVKPIVVNDKKDPRLKAYNDSLKVYNKVDRQTLKDWKNNSGNEYGWMNYHNMNHPDLKEKFAYPSNAYGDKYGIKPIGAVSHRGSETYTPIYKKPTQPVIYQKPEPTPQSTIDFMEGNYAQEPITETPQPQASAYGEVVDPRTGYTHMTRQGSPMYPMVGQKVPEMAMGGSIGGATQGIPGATGFMYARTGSIPSNGKYAKKTKASAQNGTELENAYAKWPALRNMGTAAVNKDYGLGLGLGYGGVEFMHPDLGEVNYDNGVLLNQSPGKNSTTYNPLTDDAQSVRLDMLHGMHQDPTFSKHRDAFKQSVLSDPSIKNDMDYWYNEDKKKGRAGDGRDQWMNNYIDGQMRTLLFEGDRKSRNYSDEEANQLLSNPKIKKSFNKLNDYLKTGYSYGQGPRAENGAEMKFYQEGLDFKPKSISKNGSKVIKDDRGQWDHPGEITEIGSNQITMQGVPYPVMGVSDTGDTQMMYPNQEYQYDGESVTEYPMMQDGGVLDSIVNLGKRAVNYIGGLFDDDNNVNVNVNKDDLIGYAPTLKTSKAKNEYNKFNDIYYHSPQRKKVDRVSMPAMYNDVNIPDYSKDENRIKLGTGRFSGANVSSKLIDDIAAAAKRNNIPIGQLLTLAGRESTFGQQKGNNINSGNPRAYTSGWNVDEKYQPYEPKRFLADKKVPGINVIKSPNGYQYEVTDEKAIVEHLKKNPQLINEYKKKIESTPDIGNRNSFDLSAEFLKEKGIQGYNPRDPN
jgi:hypothetical protein